MLPNQIENCAMDCIISGTDARHQKVVRDLPLLLGTSSKFSGDKAVKSFLHKSRTVFLQMDNLLLLLLIIGLNHLIKVVKRLRSSLKSFFMLNLFLCPLIILVLFFSFRLS